MFEACTLHPPPIPPPYIAARNLDALCYSVILVAQDHCQEALHDALVIEMKHKMFDFHHILYDRQVVSDRDTIKFGKYRV